MERAFRRSTKKYHGAVHIPSGFWIGQGFWAYQRDSLKANQYNTQIHDTWTGITSDPTDVCKQGGLQYDSSMCGDDVSTLMLDACSVPRPLSIGGHAPHRAVSQPCTRDIRPKAA